MPKEPKGRVRYLTHAEAQKLLQAAESMTFTGMRKSPVLRDFIELALNTGCRKGELLNLKWENIDFSNRLLHPLAVEPQRSHLCHSLLEASCRNSQPNQYY